MLPAFKSGMTLVDRAGMAVGKVMSLAEDQREPIVIVEIDAKLVGLLQRALALERDHVRSAQTKTQMLGHQVQAREDETSTYRRSERWFGQFERSFPLPASVASDQISSSMRDGILEIVLPKLADAPATSSAMVRH